MAIRLGKARTTAHLISLSARVQRIHQNLHRKMPHRAQLAHLWSLWGDESICDGCGHMIEVDEIEYELQFGRDPDAVSIRLHRECWESWSAHKLQSGRPTQFPCLKRPHGAGRIDMRRER
jgi:hypothetical protein